MENNRIGQLDATATRQIVAEERIAKANAWAAAAEALSIS
jgi:hypothetical protein